MSCVGALSSEVVYFAFGVVGIHFYCGGKCHFSFGYCRYLNLL